MDRSTDEAGAARRRFLAMGGVGLAAVAGSALAPGGAAGGAASVPYRNFVYNSAGGRGGNRYNSWADLMRATGSFAGNKTIQFERSEAIPRGRWDLSHVELFGDGTDSGYGGHIVTLGPGVKLTSIHRMLLTAIELRSTSPDPMVTINSPTVLCVTDGAILRSTKREFIRCTGSSSLAIGQMFSGQVMGADGPGTYEAVSDEGSTTIVSAMNYGSCTLNSNTYRSTGTGGELYYVIGTVNVNTLHPTHANYHGSVEMVGGGLAEAVACTPVGGFTATNLQSLIGEIDARLAAGGL